jgi:sugar (glycoside-pentoside-hexuronide) transporter
MKSKNSFLTSRFERTGYGIYFLGQNIFYGFVLNFLITYFADIGIPVATVAVVTLIIKVWDAVNDPVFGGIVDTVKFKKGKFLPWIRVSVAFIPVATILLFAIPPGLSMPVKVVWGIIAYMLWDTAYTVCDVPIFGLVTTMTDGQHERTSLMSISRVLGIMGGTAVSLLVPVFRQRMGGWLPIVVSMSLIGVIAMLPVCFAAQERVVPPVAEKPIKIRDMLRYVASNRFMLIFYTGFGVIAVTNITTNLNMIMARHLMGGEQWMALLGLIVFVPGVIVGMLIPALVRKIDKFRLYWRALAVNAALNIMLFFTGYGNIPLLLVFITLKSIPLGVTNVMMFMFTPDCIEYGAYKTGIEASGTGFAFQSFCAKFATAISTALAAALLAIVGYVEKEGMPQLPGFEQKLWTVYCLIPIIGSIIGIIILRAYKLRDADVQIMAKANRNEIGRDEAEKLLGGRYR